MLPFRIPAASSRVDDLGPNPLTIGVRTRLGRRFVAISLVCGALLLAQPALAASIPGLFTTGVDNGGLVLPGGTPDPHYTLTGGTAVVTADRPGVWAPGSLFADWIAPSADQHQFNGSTDPPGFYTYSFTFSLVGLDPTTATISGSWAVDDAGAILINGFDIGAASPGRCQFPPCALFAVTSGFVGGLNTLSFVVQNAALGAPNPTGLLVDSIVGTANAIPEPQTAVLLMAGLAVLCATRTRSARP